MRLPPRAVGVVQVKSDEFIREVDEEVKRDRMLALWKRHASLFVALGVAIVIGTSAGVGWRHWQESQRQRAAESFAAADQDFRAGREAEAAQAFAALAERGGGYGVLASLREAEARSAAGDEAGARRALDRLAGMGGADQVYRDLGRVLAGLHRLDGEAAEVDAQVAGVALPTSPWRYTARELQALARLEAGDTDGARALLGEIVADSGTPGQLRRRAEELVAALGGRPQGASTP